MKLKNVVLGIAILILTFSVVVYGVGIIYDAPEYDDFCKDFRGKVPILEFEGQICPEVCVPYYSVSGSQCVFNECGSGCLSYDDQGVFETLSECEAEIGCYDRFDDAREKYSRNLFLLTLPLGILIIFLGARFFGLESVGAGFMGGGVVVILWGVLDYWQYSGEVLKFFLSLVGLVAVIWFSYKFNKDHSKKKK